MPSPRARMATADGWVSFSDILLTLVCAVLFLRSTASSRDSAVERAREFEARVSRLEREAANLERSAQAAAEELDRIAREEAAVPKQSAASSPETNPE